MRNCSINSSAGAVFASAFTGALCSVPYRPYLAKYPALPVFDGPG